MYPRMDGFCQGTSHLEIDNLGVPPICGNLHVPVYDHGFTIPWDLGPRPSKDQESLADTSISTFLDANSKVDLVGRHLQQPVGNFLPCTSTSEIHGISVIPRPPALINYRSWSWKRNLECQIASHKTTRAPPSTWGCAGTQCSNLPSLPCFFQKT